MSTEAAASLDVSIKKIGGGTGSSIQTDVEKESRQSLIFTLEF